VEEQGMSGTYLAAEQVNSLPAPPWVLAVIAFGILTFLLLVTWSFNRNR
jgi:hypothetical protein